MNDLAVRKYSEDWCKFDPKGAASHIAELEGRLNKQVEANLLALYRIEKLKAVVAEMGEDTRLGNEAIGYGTVVVSNYLERFEEILEGASDDKR